MSSVLTLCFSTHLSDVGKQWNDFPSRHLGKKKLIMQGGTSLPTWSVLIAVRMTSVSVRLPGGHRAAPVSHRPESVRRSDGRRPILMWLSHAFVFNGACIMARRRASIGRPPCDDRPILIRSQSDSFPAPTSGTILSETYNMPGRRPTLKYAPASVRSPAGRRPDELKNASDGDRTAIGLHL